MQSAIGAKEFYGAVHHLDTRCSGIHAFFFLDDPFYGKNSSSSLEITYFHILWNSVKLVLGAQFFISIQTTNILYHIILYILTENNL